MRGRDLVGGYFYPLDAKRALDPARYLDYVAACVQRAVGEPTSTRNRITASALRLRQRELARLADLERERAAREGRRK